VQKSNIPFNKPYITPKAIEYMKLVIDRGKISGDGQMCKDVEKELKRLYGMKHLLLTTSCSHALEIAMMLLDLQPGDEVILPSFTFVSTANAILRGGGRPVFCEINDRTCTIDVGDLRRRITGKTKAIIPVHYAGVAAEMDEIRALAREHDLRVVEDAAQGVNARYKGEWLGCIGDIGAYSFHDTKNFVMGEGGAFVTNDEALARKAEIIREKGTNRANFLRGEVDKYTWVDEGSSYIQSDVLAAILKSQLEIIAEIQSGRKRIHTLYMEGLRQLEQRERLRLPVIPAYCDSNYHIFYVLLRTEEERNNMLKKLKDAGIGATFHYVSLHSSPFALRSLGTSGLRLPVTERVSGTLLRLPIYPQLENAEVGYIIEQVHEILK